MKLNIMFILISGLFAQDIFDGLVLFTPQTSGPGGNDNIITRLMDSDDNVLHTWEHARGPASMAYLMQDSTMFYPYRVSSPTMENGGVGGGFHYLDWDGNILWEYEISDNDFQHHHDIEPLPNGNLLVIAWERKTATEAYDLGRTYIGNPLNQMWGEVIFELEMVGSNDVNIVWEWHIWDHLIQDVDPSKPNYGAIADHPELMDINLGNVGNSGGPGGAHADWMHINCISYNADLDQIVLSSRAMDEIYIIDHSTTAEEAASHSGGNFGKGGDYLYRWGNPQNYDRGSSSYHLLNDQHGINWIDSGNPGEGNLICYSNSHTNSSSAVIEFVPPIDENGNYIIEDGQPYGPTDWEWIYTGGFESEMQSGAFRMPNGNTFVTVAAEARMFEVTEQGTIVWEYEYGGWGSMIARAHKYKPDHLEHEEILFGDVNYDGIINILDIVSMVNMIMDTVEVTPPADMNDDGLVNVLDIIQVVNIIVSS